MHCALLLHVAMQIGLSHLSEKRAWRIVSEDSGVHRPFLLIVRTLGMSLSPFVFRLGQRVPRDTRGFQHIAKFIYVTTTCGPSSITIKTPCELNCFRSISIVTAAVYRGFDQELRLAADPIN